MAALRSEPVICPGCRADVAPAPVGFTWWGGMLGSKLLHHVECPACHVRFSGITGRSNAGRIAAYLSLAAGLVVLLGYLISRVR